jgi:hypothetical protein
MAAKKYHAVYRLNYYGDQQFDELKNSGASYLTPERIETMLATAYESGRDDGKIEGRRDLRIDIQTGKIPPIKATGENY